MATTSEESLDIVLVFGQRKIPIHLDLSTDDGSEFITVGHLVEKVNKETNVEPSCQKLIYKGKALFKTDDSSGLKESLSSFGIHNGDRVMLLARKPDQISIHTGLDRDQSKKKVVIKAVDEKDYTIENSQVPVQQRLQNVQTEVERICLRCNELVKESRAVSESVALKSCKRSFILLHEDSMKLLEKVDAIHSNSNEDIRRVKKSIVSSLQVQLDICEKEIGVISEKLLSSD